jgi:cell division protein FtsW
MNCGVVCGALPSTGIPLPFFSLGGSSIIVTLSMCGFVLNASRGDFEDEIKADDYIQLNTINGVI